MKEIEEKFLKEEAKPVLEKYKEKVLLNILENEDKLKNQILEALMKIVNKSKKNEEFKIKYIDFSILKIGILNKTYDITAIAYGKEWYAGDMIYEAFNIDYIFQGLEEIRNDLYQKIKKYVGKIKACSVDQYILRQVANYNEYLTYFFIKYLKQYDEEISFNEMNKYETLRISYGDYKDYSQTVYYYDDSEKNEDIFKEELKDNKIEKLVFSHWTGLKAGNFKIENQDITCMNLKRSDLQNFILKSCKAVGLNLKEAKLSKCRFISSDLGTTDFSSSILEDVVFEDCILRNTKFKNAKLTNVYAINHGKAVRLENKK